jgi:NAD(P)-dependent dehydrogenase (short-subunit alcohol dehydrogenase family)
VVGLTRCLALETAQRGVRVNAICPGFVQTDLIEGAAEEFGPLLGVEPEAVSDSLLQRIPIRRFLEPDEVAELALYLASPAADGMTCQALTLSGGLVLV